MHQPGQLYWYSLPQVGEERSVPHPHLILAVQGEPRHTRLLQHARREGGTALVVCGLTTNIHRASWQGNMILDAGEAQLPQTSVVEVSKLLCVDPGVLGETIGELSAERLAQIQARVDSMVARWAQR